MKTFIHHDGALGDALLSLPCIRTIKENTRSVHLAARPDVAGLLKQAGCVDEAYSSDSELYASLYSGRTEERVRDFLSQFDRAFVFTVKGGSALAANIRKVIKKTEVIVTIPPENAGIHVAEFRLRQLVQGGSHSVLCPLLDVPPVHTERAIKVLAHAGYTGKKRPIVALHPGSGSKKKCWPLENFFELTARMKRDHNSFCIFLTGPAEDYWRKERIAHYAREHEGVLHVSNGELAVVAALLHESDLYIGNDSGITHLAAAAGISVLALFGPTDPVLWRPLGSRVEVISAGYPRGDLSTITVDEVYTRAAASLNFSRLNPLPREERRSFPS